MAANVAIPLEQPQIKVVAAPAAASPGAWLWTSDVGSRDFASRPIMPMDDNSWEARAFMEDANSLEAGIWPPRSYRCSFCRREFRCAQALGGHMNVHRRDRARLRQSSPFLGPDFASALTPLPVSAPAASADADHAQKLCLLHPKPTDSLSKLMSSAQPISAFLSTPSLISTSSTSSILASPLVLPASNYQHPDGVSSLPLSLQRLASEAASTLSRQSERSHFFSLGPMPTWPINHIANSVNVPMAATPASSSATSPPSIATTTHCRRQVSLNQLKSESPRKKSAAFGFQPYQLSINKNTSQPANTADNAHLHMTERLNFVGNSHSENDSSAAGGGLDLELRLGQTSA